MASPDAADASLSDAFAALITAVASRSDDARQLLATQCKKPYKPAEVLKACMAVRLREDYRVERERVLLKEVATSPVIHAAIDAGFASYPQTRVQRSWDTAVARATVQAMDTAVHAPLSDPDAVTRLAHIRRSILDPRKVIVGLDAVGTWVQASRAGLGVVLQRLESEIDPTSAERQEFEEDCHRDRALAQSLLALTAPLLQDVAGFPGVGSSGVGERGGSGAPRGSASSSRPFPPVSPQRPVAMSAPLTVPAAARGLGEGSQADGSEEGPRGLERGRSGNARGSGSAHLTYAEALANAGSSSAGPGGRSGAASGGYARRPPSGNALRPTSGRFGLGGGGSSSSGADPLQMMGTVAAVRREAAAGEALAPATSISGFDADDGLQITDYDGDDAQLDEGLAARPLPRSGLDRRMSGRYVSDGGGGRPGTSGGLGVAMRPGTASAAGMRPGTASAMRPGTAGLSSVRLSALARPPTAGGAAIAGGAQGGSANGEGYDGDRPGSSTGALRGASRQGRLAPLGSRASAGPAPVNPAERVVPARPTSSLGGVPLGAPGSGASASVKDWGFAAADVPAAEAGLEGALSPPGLPSQPHRLHKGSRSANSGAVMGTSRSRRSRREDGNGASSASSAASEALGGRGSGAEDSEEDDALLILGPRASLMLGEAGGLEAQGAGDVGASESGRKKRRAYSHSGLPLGEGRSVTDALEPPPPPPPMTATPERGTEAGTAAHGLSPAVIPPLPPSPDHEVEGKDSGFEPYTESKGEEEAKVGTPWGRAAAAPAAPTPAHHAAGPDWMAPTPAAPLPYQDLATPAMERPTMEDLYGAQGGRPTPVSMAPLTSPATAAAQQEHQQQRLEELNDAAFEAAFAAAQEQPQQGAEEAAATESEAAAAAGSPEPQPQQPAYGEAGLDGVSIMPLAPPLLQTSPQFAYIHSPEFKLARDAAFGSAPPASASRASPSRGGSGSVSLMRAYQQASREEEEAAAAAAAAEAEAAAAAAAAMPSLRLQAAVVRRIQRWARLERVKREARRMPPIDHPDNRFNRGLRMPAKGKLYVYAASILCRFARRVPALAAARYEREVAGHRAVRALQRTMAHQTQINRLLAPQCRALASIEIEALRLQECYDTTIASLKEEGERQAVVEENRAHERTLKGRLPQPWIPLYAVDGTTIEGYLNTRTGAKQRQHPNVRLAEIARKEVRARAEGALVEALAKAKEELDFALALLAGQARELVTQGFVTRGLVLGGSAAEVAVSTSAASSHTLFGTPISPAVSQRMPAFTPTPVAQPSGRRGRSDGPASSRAGDSSRRPRGRLNLASPGNASPPVSPLLRPASQGFGQGGYPSSPPSSRGSMASSVIESIADNFVATLNGGLRRGGGGRTGRGASPVGGARSGSPDLSGPSRTTPANRRSRNTREPPAFSLGNAEDDFLGASLRSGTGSSPNVVTSPWSPMPAGGRGGGGGRRGSPAPSSRSGSPVPDTPASGWFSPAASRSGRPPATAASSSSKAASGAANYSYRIPSTIIDDGASDAGNSIRSRAQSRGSSVGGGDFYSGSRSSSPALDGGRSGGGNAFHREIRTGATSPLNIAEIAKRAADNFKPPPSVAAPVTILGLPGADASDPANVSGLQAQMRQIQAMKAVIAAQQQQLGMKAAQQQASQSQIASLAAGVRYHVPMPAQSLMQLPMPMPMPMVPYAVVPGTRPLPMWMPVAPARPAVMVRPFVLPDGKQGGAQYR